MNVLKSLPDTEKNSSSSESHTEVSDAVINGSSSEANSSEVSGPAKRRKKKSLMARMNSATMMWIRRIHLFSGLFMLPWVLLYGFTAMLFNHSTWFSDSRIETVVLSEAEKKALPKSDEIAKALVAQLQENDFKIELAENPNSLFTRSAFASVETEKENQTFIFDLNTGSGYRRIREKPESALRDEKSEEEKSKPKPSLKKGIGVAFDSGESRDITELVSNYDEPEDPDKPIKLSIPTLEFNALVDGELKRLRFSQQSSRRRGSRPSQSKNASKAKKKPNEVKGTVVAVGENPRDMSWRSYLLRLHMAHGYGVTQNARYWWAYAVDAMFICMVFWGVSGVFMWWQIKRTRTLGFILLALSALVATYLAFAMHWQLVNG